MKVRIEDVLKEAIKTFGVEHQKEVCIEEMAELTTALMQERRGRKVDVVTEIADVVITAYELAIIYGYDYVCEEIEIKVKRLKKYINSYKTRQQINDQKRQQKEEQEKEKQQTLLELRLHSPSKR